MPEIYSHKCIKCQADYSDEDPDAYYCELCIEEKKAIAKEVNRKLAGVTSTKAPSFLQQYDEIRKQKGVRFVNINDLGIKL